MKQAFLILTAIFAFSTFASAQTGAFNFQGRLNDGTSPANGHYDLEFRLYGALTGGNQIGYTISKPNVTLVNGVFSVQLDFQVVDGISAFYTESAPKFIEIGLRPTAANGLTANAFTILGPRRQVLFVPYAIHSLRAEFADSTTSSTFSSVSDNSAKLGGVDAARFVQQDANGNVAVAGNLTASGNFSAAGNAAISGNVTQPFSANGLPKAFLRLNRDGGIVRCYNGITGASTGGCGFSIAHNFLGSYDISLGTQFPSADSLVINVTTDYDGGNTVGLIGSRTGAAFNAAVRYISNGNATNAALNITVF